MDNNFEFKGGGGIERKEPIAQFSIDMARHSIKGPKPREALSVEGMKVAVESRLGKTAEDFGEIFGSPRERTGQSSVARMFANRFAEVDFSNVDPEDIVRWMGEGGLKKTETAFLDFQLGDGDYNTEVMDNFKAGHYLKWNIEQSDKRALETKQNPDKVTPFSIQAGNIASFIFAEAWNQYNRLAEGKTAPKGVDFATSHMGVLECFLYKIIARQEGDDKARAFVESLKNQGFAENEGYKLEILVYKADDPEAWEAVLNYKDKKYSIKPDEIVSIIQESEELKKKLAEGQK